MYLKKPILASIGGESRDIIIKANCGLVSSPNNHKSLAKNLIIFAKMSNQKLKILGKNSKIFYEKNFSEKKNTQ